MHGSGWSNNFPWLECNHVTEIVPLDLSPVFFRPRRKLLFLLLLLSLLFLDGCSPFLRGPAVEGGVLSAWCLDRRAERRATRTKPWWQKEENEQREKERDIYVCVSPCIILRSFEKPKATTGCVTFAALPMGASSPFCQRNIRAEFETCVLWTICKNGMGET